MNEFRRKRGNALHPRWCRRWAVLTVILMAPYAIAFGQAPLPPSNKLDGLSDVKITSPTDKQVLTYVGSALQWENVADLPPINTYNLLDVAISPGALVTGNLFYWNGTAWVNHAPVFSDLGGNIAVTQMNSGSGAASNTYWRGDGTWAAPPTGSITATNNILVGDGSGNAVDPFNLSWGGRGPQLWITNPSAGGNYDVGLVVSNTLPGTTADGRITIANDLGTNLTLELTTSLFASPPAFLLAGDSLLSASAGSIGISTNSGANIKFSNDGGTTVVAKIGNGIAVGTPTDPGMGIVSVGTGFRIGNTAPLGHVLLGNGTSYVDGTVSGGGGGVTSFASGNLSPLFVVSPSTATTGAITQSFALSVVGANTVFGNATASTATPLFSSSPRFTAIGNLTSNGFVKTGGGIGTLSVDTTAYEPGLGNPGTSGFVLSSTTGGVRSWIAPAAGGGTPTGTGFYHVTGGVMDTASKLVDVSSADITGNLGVSHLNTGTGASSTTFWRGDGTWNTPAGGGNVSNVGTPTNLQIAQWTGATTIQGLATTGTGSAVLATSPIITSPNIGSLSNLTTNGFVKTSSGSGLLSVDTNTYLTGNQSISLTGDATGTGATSIATTVGKINGTSLAGLATGLLKNTTATGVPSIAAAGTDYEAALGNPSTSGFVLSSTTGGTRSWIGVAAAPTITSKGDVAYTILATDNTIVTSAALTTTRTWTLPVANTVSAGKAIQIMDLANGITASNNLNIGRSGTDTIWPGNSIVIALRTAGEAVTLVSDGSSKWFIQNWNPGKGTVNAFPQVNTIGDPLMMSAYGLPANAGSSGQMLQATAGSNSGWTGWTMPTSTGSNGTLLQWNGGNVTTSTPAWPTAAGSSGVIVQSNGTNFITSTPTWPNTATGSGKILQDNGTNFVESTPTWPTTAGSAGSVPRSNGTNYLNSALAFSDLTGSATVAQLPVMVASGASHAAGIAPDPGVTAGTTHFLREDATWAVPSGGTGSPGGSTTQVQYNDAGAFNGDAALTFTKATGLTTFKNGLTIGAGPTSGDSWIDLPTTGASGIGQGGAGTNPWIAYAGGAGNYFSDTGVGDIAYRAANGTRQVMGNAGGGGTNGTFSIGLNLIELNNSSIFEWSSTSGSKGSPDTAFARNAAGVVEVNNGTAGTYRDILARGLRSNATTFSNATTAIEGTTQAFTDSTTNVNGATITGGGSNHVQGYYNGTNWVVETGTGSGGAPGGSTTQVQYNNSGVLGGITNLTTDGTSITKLTTAATGVFSMIGNTSGTTTIQPLPIAGTGTITLPQQGGVEASNGVVTSTVTQTAITETAHVVYTVPAGTARVGTTFRIVGWGNADNGTTAITYACRIRWGGTGGVNLTSPNLQFIGTTTAQTNKSWKAVALVTIRTIGATGTAFVSNDLINHTASSTGVFGEDALDSGATGVTINTTTSNDLDLTWTLSATTGAPVIRTLGGFVETIQP